MIIYGHVMHMMLYMLYASLCVCAYMDSQSMADFSPQFGVPNLWEFPICRKTVALRLFGIL